MYVQHTWPQQAAPAPQLEQPWYLAAPQYPAVAMSAVITVMKTATIGTPNKRVIFGLLQANCVWGTSWSNRQYAFGFFGWQSLTALTAFGRLQ
jgi:hypothetical protein